MSDSSFTIDCGTCVMRQTTACDDCIVSYICEREPDDAVVIPMAEFVALKELGSTGLVPKLRHKEDRTG